MKLVETSQTADKKMSIKTITYGKHNFPVKFVCLNMSFSCMETSVCPKIQSLSVGKLKSIFRELID